MITLLFTISAAGLFAQSPSPEQDWPQSHEDEPYSVEPEQSQRYGDQTRPYAEPQQSYADSASPSRQPLDAGQLEQLIAPIALYPDALVAQVLAASTYPQQVAEADRWRFGQGNALPDEIAAGADAQDWDPSVKALTAFPEVLTQMDRNLQWTTDLGNAYYNQPEDVLEAVQVMRRRAQAAGTLRSTQQEVVRYDEGNVVLAPQNPQVVYVPTYNPWTVYGEPVSPYPGFNVLGAIADIAGVLPLRYGLGIAVASFTQPWGWLAWGLDWLGHALLFNQSDYYSHSNTVADWGFSHRGFYAYRGRDGFARGGRNFARMGGGEQWRYGSFNGGGWHGFNRGPEHPIERSGDRSSRGFASNRGFNATHGYESGRGFESSRGFQPYSNARNGFARPMERLPENRSGYRSPQFNRGVSGFSRSERYRASAGNFPRNEFRQPRSLTRSSVNSHSGPFSGGHSHDNFASVGHSRANFGSGHSSFHSSGHAPKNFGGGHSRGGGGNHSHGGGGHGGGKHHH